MLSDADVQEFHANGYLKGSQILSDEEVETLRAEVLRVIEGREAEGPQPVLLRNFGKEDSPVWQIVNIWMVSPPFRQLVEHPAIVEEIAQLTGARALRLFHDQIQYKPASKGGVNMWHQDAPLWPILKPMTEVSAWVALDDVDEENGCMWMVPGSHLWGDHMAYLRTVPSFDELPKEFDGHTVEVLSRPVAKGEVHYHHALTWHGSGPNVSGRPRRAIALHYMTDETRFVASGEHVMKPFVEASDGEHVMGEGFPLVWESAPEEVEAPRMVLP